MAKKKKSKKTSRKRTTTTKKKPKASAKRTASKRTAARRKQPKAARRKVAARAAATRNRKPEQPKTRLETAAAYARGAVATVAEWLPWPANENDPIALLKTDHRRFEKLLEEGEQTTERAGKGRREILQRLVKELTVHEAIEEQILYPALEPHPEARQTTLEGFEEHHVADGIAKELEDTPADDEKWGAKFKVLKESITHHITEEERLMFPAARGVLAREELLALGARMRKLKAELERG